MLKTEGKKYAIIPGQKQQELVRVLAEVNEGLGGGKDLKEILEIASNGLSTIMNCSRVSILIKEEEQDNYTVKEEVGENKNIVLTSFRRG